MAKLNVSADTVRSWVAEYPDLTFDGVNLSCNACDVMLSMTRKSIIVKHLSSKSHKDFKQFGGKRQQQFNLDLVKFMVSCNIPWAQLDNPAFREFVETCMSGQYSDVHLPKSSMLRTKSLPQVANNVVKSICSEHEGKDIWLSVDETTNASGWKVANVLVGALDELHANKAHLLASKVLDATNSDTITTLVHDALRLLWGNRYEDNKEKFILFITDAAAYMKLAGRMLQETYPSVLHVTCLAHALHRVAETVREYYPKVDTLISSVKKIFLKAPERTRLFYELAPNVPLPPSPIVTRWGTWIDAAIYYFDNLDSIIKVLTQLDASQAVAIATAQQTVMDPTVKQQLKEIHNFFSRIPLAIRQLEQKPQVHFSLIDEMNVIYDLRQYIGIALFPCESLKLIREKLDNVLQNNPGFATLCAIEKLLRRQEVDLGAPGIHKSAIQHYQQFRYAPITSVDIERTFSIYKWIFADRRRSLSPTHLEQILLIYSYYQLDKKPT